MWDVIAAELAKGGPLAGWLLAAVMVGVVGFVWRTARADAKAAREAMLAAEVAHALALKQANEAHLADLRNLVISLQTGFGGLAKALSTKRLEASHDGPAE